ncbi:hypothetical protein SERLA73DRAFT_68193 [Serpula lacrymans var. lacrymans S7.3]|uniref:Uncharacterized protein n=2 Tax=Serpula lacrymans var. lacrymans TaxID=341189 RepID=F8PHH5_SERL3|nr:hypothetical protein SERLA73DRAFT_68193 [Serpula lacrymans var. lacrymans S7.3]
MHQGGGSTTKNNYSQRRPGSSNQHNHSHGFKLFGLQQGQGAPMDIGAKDTCPKTVEMGRGLPNNKNNQGCQARQLETEKPDDQLNTLAGRSYDKIQAFFYD